MAASNLRDDISTTFFTEFTKAAKVQLNNDGISSHSLAPYNAYYLTQLRKKDSSVRPYVNFVLKSFAAFPSLQ